MDISQSILSDITIFNKYARYYPEIERRETWEEIAARNMKMHIMQYPELEIEIRRSYKNFVVPKKVLPSMRSMQFGGIPVEMANNRIFNCAYLPAEHPDSFSEMMFLLLGGTGVGYSVQKQHVAKLPVVAGLKDKKRRFLIGDSIEGWADAVKVLVEAYFKGKSDPQFDFRDIRPKGARLITAGGKAPGPDPLRICLDQLRGIFQHAVERQLTTIEVHDIMCHIADAVLSGGIRRAALIALFSRDDMDMLSCKSGSWWELNPQRGRANNSAVLPRDAVDKDEFLAIWERIKDSGSGEPGIYWTDDTEMGTNPCCEIALKPYQFCNLTEINASDVTTQDELNDRAKVASLIGTLQAGYTNFHYLRQIWRETTEAEALIGVGMTGIASGGVLNLDLGIATQCVLEENKRIAKAIGVNSAARTTCVKPSGTTSLVVGSSSGIHAWHAPYYIRRMRVGKNEALYHYMLENFPMLIEDCKFKPHLEAVMSFPQKAPEGAIIRTESYLDLLERVKKFSTEWVLPGHINGSNTHNVSCTISLKVDEWEPCGEWMWNNRRAYNGISVLPMDLGTYVQAPFTDCTKEEFEELIGQLHAIDISKVIEQTDETDLKDQAACSGGICELNFG